MGYSSLSGASAKALATLHHFGLMERASKGEARVSQLAVDILHPESEATRKAALLRAAMSPDLFQALRERFPDDKFSEEALRSFLVRQNFQNRAIDPVVGAYMETIQFLEQERAYESHGVPDSAGRELERDTAGDATLPAERSPAPPPPPPRLKEIAMSDSERILATGPLSKESGFRLIVSGRVGVKEIERLIKKLEFDKEILADEDEKDGEDGEGEQ